MGAPTRTVRTRRIDERRALPELLPDEHAVFSWVSGGDGIVGWGEYARYEPCGADRFTDTRAWWDGFLRDTTCEDEVGLPGTGPVAFTSIAFADEPGRSVLVVPEVLVGRRGGVTWVTTVDGAKGALADAPPLRQPRGLRFTDGDFPATAYRKAVAAAVRRIRASELEKVVLAHDELAVSDEPLDPRWLLRQLADSYPSCWTYAVDGLVGATPEMLLRKRGDTVTARLLAGTTWPGRDQNLLGSAKNRGEHGYGVDSLTAALRPWCRDLSVPAEPGVLRLHNVAHLATEVTGTVRDETSLLRLAAEVHPTAAVGGAPTDKALRTIAELEHMDRGRYAGPVGWIDAAGDGELGVALRCAQLDGSRARLLAGGGIVAGSDPDTEAAEAAAKMVPVRDALTDGNR